MSTATRGRTSVVGGALKLGAVAAVLVAAWFIVPAVLAVPDNQHNAGGSRYDDTPKPTRGPQSDRNTLPRPIMKVPPSLEPGRHTVNFTVTWGPTGHPELISYGYSGHTATVDPRTLGKLAVWHNDIPYVPGTNYFVMAGIYGRVPADRSALVTIGIDGKDLDAGVCQKGKQGACWAWIGLPPVGNWAPPGNYGDRGGM